MSSSLEWGILDEGRKVGGKIGVLKLFEKFFFSILDLLDRSFWKVREEGSF